MKKNMPNFKVGLAYARCDNNSIPQNLIASCISRCYGHVLRHPLGYRDLIQSIDRDINEISISDKKYK